MTHYEVLVCFGCFVKFNVETAICICLNSIFWLIDMLSLFIGCGDVQCDVGTHQ